jgi:hypothetical protein
LQIFLAALRDAAWITIVSFLGSRLRDGACDRQRRHRAERIDERRGRIGHREHVGRFDRFPAADGGAIEAEPFLEDFLGEFADGTTEMLPGAEGIDEFDIDHFGALLARQFDC